MPPLRVALRILLFAAAIACAATIVAFERDRQRSYARIASASRLASTPCGPIEYAIAGTGPPVLLIHGAGGGFDQGLQFGAPLIEAGFTVISPSRFGYLRTPVPADSTPAAQADAHACLLDALHVSQAAVFGGSAGAPSAAQLCIRHQKYCSSLVLVVPALATSSVGTRAPSRLAQFLIETTLRSDFLFWAFRQVARETLVESILATPREDLRSAPASEKDRVFAALSAVAPIRPRVPGLRIDARITTAPATYEFEELRVPTLVVTTRNDGFNTLPGATVAASRIPGARLIVFDDGGHMWVGHQDALWSAVTEFVRH